MLIIVDYGMGNIGSLQNMFKKIGVDAISSSDPDIICKASHLVLPGVGSYDTALHKIDNIVGLMQVLNNLAMVLKIPILGICLGMQLIVCDSEEGKLPGLNWIPGHVYKFPNINNLKVPHMGWNNVNLSRDTSLINKIDSMRYYFVHSYYVKVDNDNDSIMKTTYGITFDSAINRDNIFGVQFHPEKSHRYGIELLTNFSKL